MAPKQIDFIVNTGDPNAASNSANKKRVRSVAALKSWPERRRKVFEQLENSSNGRNAFLVDEPSHRKKAYAITKKSTKKPAGQHSIGPARPSKLPAQLSDNGGSTTLAVVRAPMPTPIDDASVPYHEALSKVPATSEAVAQVHAMYADLPCLCSQCTHKRIVTNTVLGIGDTYTELKRMNNVQEKWRYFAGDVGILTPPSSPDSPSRGRADPFNCYPVPYQPWFDHVLHHMMTVYAPRGWPALKITDSEGSKWEWFMTQNALSEPALFYVRLLFGSGDMIRLGTLRNELQYWLRAQAIAAINSALRDPSRACSDALILAVGRIALHEHMYGDKYAACTVHRPAQKRMVEMRGGMKALPFPELVKRLMRWSDRIMAVGSGTERLLEDDVESPNFTIGQSVGAIEHWAPHQVGRVRQAIKISDLVNDEERDEIENRPPDTTDRAITDTAIRTRP